MVVPVLITSCQVSEKPNSGPVPSHTSTTIAAKRKLSGEPTALAIPWAKRRNVSLAAVTATATAAFEPPPRTGRFGRLASARAALPFKVIDAVDHFDGAQAPRRDVPR